MKRKKSVPAEHGHLDTELDREQRELLKLKKFFCTGNFSVGYRRYLDEKSNKDHLGHSPTLKLSNSIVLRLNVVKFSQKRV